METNLQQQALLLLRQALDNSAASFRTGQWEAIQELIEKRSRLLVVQRTGWGKSIVYFLATRLLRNQSAGCTLNLTKTAVNGRYRPSIKEGRLTLISSYDPDAGFNAGNAMDGINEKQRILLASTSSCINYYYSDLKPD
jgi:hypothetical protein